MGGTRLVEGPQARRSIQAMVAGVVALACQASTSAEIYTSVGPDGTARYATQPLDSTYQAAPPTSERTQSADDRSRGKPMEPALRSIVAIIASRHQIPTELVEAIIMIESAGNVSAVSAKGARGPMQLMPSTAKRYGVEIAQLHQPERNIEAGVRHFKELLTHYQGNVALALAAYNAGSGAVRRHGERIPPYPETMLYVPAVLGRTAAQTAP